MYNFQHFAIICTYISPWKKGMAILLNKFQFPILKDALCQVSWNLLIGSAEKDF